MSDINEHDPTYDDEAQVPELTGVLSFADGDFIDEYRWEEGYDYEPTTV